MASIRRDKKWLLDTAITVAHTLKERNYGTALSIRIPSDAIETNTSGWRAVIGNLGKNKPRLEIWFDRFSGYPERKLFACFQSENRQPMMEIVNLVSEKLWPVRVVTVNDIVEQKFMVLTNRLDRSEFNAPILEKYKQGLTFFGIYDPTRETTQRVNTYFCDRAVAFFEDVARALPSAKTDVGQRDVYPRHENRKSVVSHLQRERSRLLATERKILDDYICQVCEMRFDKVYGKDLGAGFAEAHHIIPLGKLKGIVRTSLEDLRTVCANCHRMLHRMDGNKDDIKKLRAIVKRQRKEIS